MNWCISSTLAALMTIAILPAAAAALPAFPGAEGHGAHATGGRGGDVYVVANLNREGPGSFAEGLRTVPPAGRTIVFAVSGHIPIRKLQLKASNVTIAGQTAPGDGVALTGSSFLISGSNVVVRFLRIRHGKRGNGGDALNTDSGARDLMIDHCDVMFANDENFSMFRTAPPTMTFQWSINAWGLKDHSCGGLWLVDHATAHHTLWANNHTRNPKVIKPLALDWINNVNFGWDIGMNLAGADVPGTYRVNIRGSSFIAAGRAQAALFGGGVAPDGTMPFHVYLDDCDATLSGTNYHRATAPHPQTAGVPVTVDDRRTAYKKVISQVGAVRMEVGAPLRDAVAALLIDDVVAQRRRMIGDERELGVSDALRGGPAPLDTDKDGMPDAYEAALGWDPAAQDHNVRLGEGSTFVPAGYTRLEEYLHFLAMPHATIRGPLTVDLQHFTAGFTSAPVCSARAIAGGTVSLAGARATFTPTPGHAGRARFDFTVRDSEGSTWTQTCALVVTKP